MTDGPASVIGIWPRHPNKSPGIQPLTAAKLASARASAGRANKAARRLIRFDGEAMALADVAARFGVDPGALAGVYGKSRLNTSERLQAWVDRRKASGEGKR